MHSVGPCVRNARIKHVCCVSGLLSTLQENVCLGTKGKVCLAGGIVVVAASPCRLPAVLAVLFSLQRNEWSDGGLRAVHVFELR